MIDYTDYVELFRIVPVNDGFHYMCMNCFEQFYFAHKATDHLNPETLYFINEIVAQQFIDKYLDRPENELKIYKPEFILLRADYAPESVIEVVK